MIKKKDPVIQIDKRSNEPVEIQIANQIKALVLTYTYDEEITDIAYIKSLLDVDIAEIKKAFEILVSDRIFSIDNHGNYDVFYQDVVSVGRGVISSVYDNIKYLNQTFSMKVFDKKDIKCDKILAKLSEFKTGDHIHYQKRIYYGDGKPKAYMELYFSKDSLPNINDEKFNELPYYHMIGLDQNPKIPAYRRLEVIRLSDEINNYLDQSVSSNGFFSEESYFSKDKKILLFVKIYLNLSYFIRLVG